MKALLPLILKRASGAEPVLGGASPLISYDEAMELACLPSSETTDIISLGGIVRSIFAPEFFKLRHHQR